MNMQQKKFLTQKHQKLTETAVTYGHTGPGFSKSESKQRRPLLHCGNALISSIFPEQTRHTRIKAKTYTIMFI